MLWCLYLKAVLVRHDLFCLPLVQSLSRASWSLTGQSSSRGPVRTLRQIRVRHLDADLVAHYVLKLRREEQKSQMWVMFVVLLTEGQWADVLPVAQCSVWVCPWWRRCRREWWTFPSESPRTETTPCFHRADSSPFPRRQSSNLQPQCPLQR